MLNRENNQKEESCKPPTSDDGYTVTVNNPLYERGFLLRYCLRTKISGPQSTKATKATNKGATSADPIENVSNISPTGTKMPTDEDFVNNYRVNIIAIPNNN